MIDDTLQRLLDTERRAQEESRFSIVFAATGVSYADAHFFREQLASSGVLGNVVMFINLASIILETAVGRPPGWVRRGAWQGESGPVDPVNRRNRSNTRRNSLSIPTSCNAARRRAVRALVVVAPLTSRVSPRFLNTHQQNNHLLATRSGQLRLLGSSARTSCRSETGAISLSPTLSTSAS